MSVPSRKAILKLTFFLGAWLSAAAVGRAESGAQASAQDELVQPRLKNQVQIDYPAHLTKLASPPQGTVKIKFVVGTDGVPKELEIIQKIHPELDALARSAIAKLRYEPGKFKGQVCEVVLAMALEIGPPNREPEPEEQKQEHSRIDVPMAPVRMQGTILQAGQRTPVEGASILVVPADPASKPGRVRRKQYEEVKAPAWTVQTTSQADGRFEVRGLPAGLVRVIVLIPGFERIEYTEKIIAGKTLEVKYYPERLEFDPYRTVVSSRRGEDLSQRSISATEINNIPGTQGDALKSLQNFPGVARAPFGAGLLLIRGSAPGDSRVYLGYHEIPQLFHFGAVTSVFNSDLLTQIDFMPGNFDSRFGDAIGGIVNVSLRKGRRDGVHGYVDADVFDIGVLVEGPIGKGSYALSARRSYIDTILNQVLPKDSGLGFTQAPRYYDYQGLFDYPVGDGELSVRVFGSDDRLKLITQNENEEEVDERNRAGAVILFHRVDMMYRQQKGPWEFLLTPSYRYQQASGNALGIFTFVTTNHDFSGRAEISRRLSRRASIRIGTEINTGTFTIDAEAPSIPTGGGVGATGVTNVGQLEGSYAAPALYTTMSIGLGDRFRFYPGARLQYYAVLLNKFAIDPRLRFAWDIADRTAIKGGVGLYSQIGDIPEFNEIWGNPKLGVERSVHTSLGIEQDFAEKIKLEVTGFYKYIWDQATPSTQLRMENGQILPENFANQGIGHIAGVELLVRKELTKRFFGWLSYTFIRSLTRAKPGDELKPFAFDQPHILTLIGVVRLPRNWQVGARFRLVSGNPTVPIFSGIFAAQNGSYLPLQAANASERLPMFHQLDLRVDKHWILRRMEFNLYLDVQNVYNHRNIEAWNYAYNFQQRVGTAGLPIIPSLGLKVAF